jgi:hypothetical protein
MPVNQSLTDNEKELLASIGDSLQNAVILNADSVGFSSDEVLYKKIDTLGYNDIFVYSQNPDSAVYRVGFLYVGENNGDYIKEQTAANGKVYKWIQPQAGLKQGNYAPVRILITPKKKQMANIGGEIKISNTLKTNFELAVSNNDINTFSDIDNQDNDGYAMKFGVLKDFFLRDTQSVITTKVNYRLINKDFTAIQRFRTAEYSRDWNLNSNNVNNQEQLIEAGVGFEKQNLLRTQYTFSLLNQSTEYKGIKNGFNANIYKNGFNLDLKASLLNTTNNLYNSDFLRYYGTFSKKTKIITAGVHLEQEKNIQHNDTTDNINPASFDYMQWEVFVNNTDSQKSSYYAKYIHRDDYKPYLNNMKYTSRADNIKAGFDFFKNRKNTLKTIKKLITK